MIEVSITEIVLFVWAAIATGIAIKSKSDANGLSRLLHRLTEDKELYNQFHEGWLRHNSMYKEEHH